MDTLESNLIMALKSGDQESCATLYELYGKKIYNLAYRMSGSKEDAEDILQQTFMQVYQSIGGFRFESGIYTWLYAIAKNNCLRLLENRKKSSLAMLDSLVNSVKPQKDEDAYTSVEKAFYIGQVKEGCLLGLLRCLSFFQRAAFILHVLLDFDVKNTAVILGKSETATRLLIHRSKRNIKDFLCKNCSLYQPGNPCRCENLIGFSLKQSWIMQMPDSENAVCVSSPDIEAEIGELEKLTVLYKGLETREPPAEVTDKIRKEIENQSLLIFSGKKVK